MVLKKAYLATEDLIYVEGKGCVKVDNLPEELVREARAFAKRNSLSPVACNLNNKQLVHCCCPRCLKAHLLGRCSRFGRDAEKKVNEILDCELGHEGYYLDGSSLIKS